MAFSLFGNKEVKAAQAWCKEYAIDSEQKRVVMEAVKAGYTADEAIKIGCQDYRNRAEAYRHQQDTLWAERGSRSDRHR